MFEVNDVIVYGAEGICRITGIESKTFSGEKKEYYVLKPETGSGSTIYVPLGNEKLLARMHRLPSREEVDALINSLSDSVPNWIENDNERKVVYSRILADNDRRALIGMLKALYLQKKEREAQRKFLRMSDERIMKEAEQLLYNEWQYVLKISREDLMAYICDHVEKSAEP